MPFLTLRARTICCITPTRTLTLTEDDLNEVKNTHSLDELRSERGTFVDRFYGAQKLAAKQWLHALYHNTDAKVQVRSFVQLLEMVTPQDEPNFRGTLLRDDIVELKIMARNAEEPIACVRVSRLGNFSLHSAKNGTQALLRFGDAHDPLLEIPLEMTDGLRDALAVEPGCERLLAFFDHVAAERANDIDMRRFCEVLLAQLENHEHDFNIEVALNAIATHAASGTENIPIKTRVSQAYALETLATDLSSVKHYPAIAAQVCREARNKLCRSASAEVYKTMALENFRKLDISPVSKGSFTTVKFSKDNVKTIPAKTKLRINIKLLWLSATDTSNFVIDLFDAIKTNYPAIVAAKTNNILLTGMRQPGYTEHTFTNNQITMYFQEGTSPIEIDRIAHRLEALAYSAFGIYHVCRDIGGDVAIEGCRYVSMRVETVTKHGFDMAKFVREHRTDLFINIEIENLKLIVNNKKLTQKCGLLPTSFDIKPVKGETFEDLIVYNLVKIMNHADIEDMATTEKMLLDFFKSTHSPASEFF